MFNKILTDTFDELGHIKQILQREDPNEPIEENRILSDFSLR